MRASPRSASSCSASPPPSTRNFREQNLAASVLGADDVAIGFSYTGVTEPVVNALRVAADAGATTIAITHHPTSPLVQAAHIRLLAAVIDSTGQTFHSPASHIAMLGIVETLYAALSLRRSREEDHPTP